MNTKTEVFHEKTETPRQRFWRRAESAFYALVAAVIVTLTVLGVFDQMLVT